MQGKTTTNLAQGFSQSFKKDGDLDEVNDIDGITAHLSEDPMPRKPLAVSAKKGMHNHSISINAVGFKKSSDQMREPSIF